jgi:hypothetical protein
MSAAQSVSRFGCVAVLAAAAFIGLACPTARADADGYLRCVKGGLGGYVPDDDALSIGRTVSELLARNQPPEAIANRIYSNGATGFSLSEAQTIVACVQRNQPL